MKRYAYSVSLGSAVTFALFLLMQSLVAYSSPGPGPAITGEVIEFVMVTPESTLEVKRHLLPDRPENDPPPEQPPIEMPPPLRGESPGTPVPFPPPPAEGPQSAGPIEGDVVPLVRIEPTYPSRAHARGEEGWALLEFSISPAGTVIDPFVVDSEPPGTFDRAALRAVARWRYKPKIDAMGSAVTRHGIQVVLTFEIGD